tara:strand:- start:10249 stop:11517 length:1269 start_codon:yes stop_codon:yes gene_type:complete
MIHRRHFLKISLISGVSVMGSPKIYENSFLGKSDVNGSIYRLTRDIPIKFFDGKSCFVHPRAGIIPGAGKEGMPRIFLTMNTLDLSGSDVFKAMYGLYSDDFGKTWTTPKEIEALNYHYELLDGSEYPVAVGDFWPSYNRSTGALLGIGHSVMYTKDWKVMKSSPRNTTYSTYDPQKNKWAAWQSLIMPDNPKFFNSGAGSVQRYDEGNGSILLPMYFNDPSIKGNRYSTTVMRCQFDGKTLRYVENGSELTVNSERGLVEPSLMKFGDRFFLTMRNDYHGYVTTGNDGLHFDDPIKWTFDDGSDLGNYNTQQHWVSHSDGLFLVYTRRDASNNHVFRHRAPLFMAQVDTERLCIIRSTEEILVPEAGARLGNFGVTDINQEETWVTVSEWMQPEGVEKYGSDGKVWVARIHWNKPNLNFEG